MEYTGLMDCWYPRPKAHRSNMQAKNNTVATQPTAKKNDSQEETMKYLLGLFLVALQ
jgi:hypothetical protein